MHTFSIEEPGKLSQYSV